MEAGTGFRVRVSELSNYGQHYEPLSSAVAHFVQNCREGPFPHFLFGYASSAFQHLGTQNYSVDSEVKKSFRHTIASGRTTYRPSWWERFFRSIRLISILHASRLILRTREILMARKERRKKNFSVLQYFCYMWIVLVRSRSFLLWLLYRISIDHISSPLY